MTERLPPFLLAPGIEHGPELMHHGADLLDIRMILLYNVCKEGLTGLLKESDLILLDEDAAINLAVLIVQDFHTPILGHSRPTLDTFPDKFRRGDVIHKIPEGERIAIKALLRIFYKRTMFSPLLLGELPLKRHLDSNFLIGLRH